MVVCRIGRECDLQERLVVSADAIALVQHAILDELFAELLQDRLFVSGGHVGARALILSWICGEGREGEDGGRERGEWVEEEGRGG